MSPPRNPDWERTTLEEQDETSAGQTVGRESMDEVNLNAVMPAMLDLPQLALDGDGGGDNSGDSSGDGSSPDFRMGKTIGAGGMGRIRLAQQVALGRDVAIKQLLDSRKSPKDVAALIREARITGRLEHPNIVPVHWIGYCGDGVGPVVVMKRVKGRAWNQALEDVDRRDENAVASQVDVLLRVCDAIDYAHSQGIIHRDIKPGNVMLGDFGEVYVVDWGIAVELETWKPDGKAVGTPAYMAPEMADPSVQRPDERSDVFLLGATLYQVLFGRAPRAGQKARAAMAAAADPLQFPDGIDVPEELVDICQRACEVDPASRFESVAEFRAALRQYLQHRSGARLATQAHEQLAEIRREMHTSAPDYANLIERLDAVKHQFRAADELWPDSAPARRGLSEIVAPTITGHIALGNLPAARQLADQAGDELAPELLGRLEGLERDRELDGQARHHVEVLQREQSLSVGGDQRSGLLLALAAGLLMTVAYVYISRRGTAPGSPEFLFTLGLVCLGFWVALLLLRRKRLSATYVDRTAALSITVIFLVIVVHRALALVAGWDRAAIVQVDLLLISGPLFVLGTLHRSFYAVGTIPLFAAAISVFVPESARVMINAVPALLVILVSILWKRIVARASPAPPRR